ncbi:MAG: right-handed parallel beta-helix repeat-containing protein [Chitinophaga sp.]|uniref:PDZ domain-containing protein n=1 Tax=Chitinophaga sp. TaxID=1869181 RepID=UPI001B14612B|nr:PDZ domain-containing protein [Chitinophaga sp.]MBO9728732.1 right-handed parallel beta-helix repeat-containing protein [Chitinophaga sp.]
MKKLFFFCCIVSTQWVAAQTVLHVSVTGNDRQPGTAAKPLKTVHRAVELAMKKKNEPVTVWLHGGTYYLDQPLILQAANMACKRLDINAWQQEEVFISAGRQLSLDWKPWKNGIYVATVPAGVTFERLFVNGRLQVLARYPDYDSTAKVFHGTAADALSRARKWQHPENGYVHALHAYDWGGFHYRITGKKDTLTLEGGWQNNRPNVMHPEYRFVENNLEELDVAGEWFLDNNTRQLYYYPSGDIQLQQARIEVAHLKNSIVLKGSAAAPVKNVTLRGLHFIHNERTFMDTREPLLRSDWTIYRGGAVLLDGTENCRVMDCSFSYLGGNAIMLSNYNVHDTISGCYLHHLGASAVCFVGDVKAVRSPDFRYEDFTPYRQLDKTPGPASNNYPRECVVTNSLIHHVGDIEKQATGVEITISSGITVSHNSIYNTPRAGINIGDGCFGGHVLAYNDVFNTVMETGDHGAFNSWGRDRYWAPDRGYMDSLVAVHPELIKLDAQETTTIRNNRFRCDHGWDIDLDDGSSNYHIYNNVCLNGGLKLREGFQRIVENNIMINNSFHPHVWFKNSGDVFAHNIVTRRYAPIEIKAWGREVDYNLFPDAAALQEAQAQNTDAHSIAGDPQFLDAATGNYQVAKTSPAFKIGFQNIPMDSFGVMKPALRKIALQPEIPVFLNLSRADAGTTTNTSIVELLGGKIKSIEGLGERSAYGLADESGALVLSAGENTLLSSSGIKTKDVIIAADGKPVKTAADLQDIVKAAAWKSSIPVKIMRNQQVEEIILKVK